VVTLLMVKKRKNHVEEIPGECPLSKCMAFIGGAWIPNIIWYLSDQPRRFSELKDDLQGISPKVLSDKLKKMESDGLVVRSVQPTTPPTVEYALTPLGKEFKPIIKSIAQVGHKLKHST
jgi:DNA-binding HxlR family transcriptional regulator